MRIVCVNVWLLTQSDMDTYENRQRVIEWVKENRHYYMDNDIAGITEDAKYCLSIEGEWVTECVTTIMEVGWNPPEYDNVEEKESQGTA